MSSRSTGGGGPTRKPIQILRERCGGVSREMKEQHRHHRRLRKAIREALGQGPRTVPELAAEIGAPSDQTLWMLMAMKKYGEIAEGDERDGYHEYAVQAEEAKR